MRHWGHAVSVNTDSLRNREIFKQVKASQGKHRVNERVTHK